ncbi:MAG: hypothetical protein ACLUNZ_05375 [Evtepia sp.]
MRDRLAQHLGNAVETTEVDLPTLQDRVTALWNEAQAQVRSLADRRKGLEAQQNRRKQLEQRLPQEQAQLTQVSQHKQTAEQALAGERSTQRICKPSFGSWKHSVPSQTRRR